MNATFSANKPEDIEFSLTLTMKLKDWLQLREQLSSDYPSWRVGSEISDMVMQAKTVFFPELEKL
jgi:hypothetical protein